MNFASVTQVPSWPVSIVRRGSEDLQEPNLGPARGSDSAMRRGGSIVRRIKHAAADPALGVSKQTLASFKGSPYYQHLSWAPREVSAGEGGGGRAKPRLTKVK